MIHSLFVVHRQSFGQRGSALVATVMIAGTVALILAGIGRLTVRELRSSAALEDASLAFAAAEAGIEEGLLRWRFNRNVTLPILPSGQEMSEAIFEGNRVNLTLGNVGQRVSLVRPPLVTTESVYDVRIWYKAPTVGDPGRLTESTYPFRLAKDQTLELDLSGLVGQSLVLTYLPFEADRHRNARIETRVIAEDLVTGAITEVCSNCKRLWDVNQSPIIIGPIPGTSGDSQQALRLRIKPLIFGLDSVTPAGDASYIAYSLSVKDAPAERTDRLLDTGLTFIESTGYYGTAKRKLVARVDRRTGTVLGVYDFVLFSGEAGSELKR